MLKVVKLKNISTLIGSGVTPLRSNPLYWDNGTISWLKTEQLGEAKIYDTTEKISQYAIEETGIKIFPINTISVAMYGEGRTRGNVSILKQEMTTNQACCNIVIDEEKADYEYVFYYLKTQYNQLRNLSSGVRKNLNSNDIKEFEIRLPKDLPTQRQIASVLSSLDAKIELNNKINSQLEALAKTIYDYWFVQFDFPTPSPVGEGLGEAPYKSSGGKMVYNEELKREIPEGWEVKKMSEIIEVKDGTHDSPKYLESGYPLITSKHLLDGGIDFTNSNLVSEEDFISINKRSKVDTGDILFSMIGTVGTIYKVEEIDINFAIKNVALFKTSQKLHFKNFVYMYLKSWDMFSYMTNTMSGSIQKFMSLGDLRKIPILISDEVIANYVQATNFVFEKINNNKLQNQHLSSLRDWLLPMLMNGQVTVGAAQEVLGMVAEDGVGYGDK